MRVESKSFRVGLAVLLLAPIALAAVSGDKDAPVARRYINLPGKLIQAPFSEAVLAGNTLYIAGSIGLDPKTGHLALQPEDEAKIILEHMKAILAAAGMTTEDLVSVQVFCSDVALFDRFNGVYRTYFAKDFPARAFIGAGPLLFGAHFEVMGTAVKR